MNKYKYKFSIIIPVYNVEEYVEETLNSVINQSIGFKENVQVIMINDGSTDNSEEICLKYKNMYPDNIVYISKQNEGVSKARNLGMEYIEGKYVNFFDSDDIWDLTTFEKVYKILEENPDVNIASCKVQFFDAKKGSHILNYRFSDGTQVVNINEKTNYIQTFIATVFFRYDRIKDKRFDENLKYAEDVKFVNELFLEDDRYAVVANATYFYRKRKDASSATQMGGKNKFYYEALEKSYLYLVNANLEKYGTVKKYFQEIVMYELQWRLKRNIDYNVMNEEEGNQYIEIIKNLLKNIDNDVILGQKSISYPYKLLAFQLKYGKELKEKMKIINDEVFIDMNYFMNVNEIVNIIGISRVKNDYIYIDGSVILLDDEMELYYAINDDKKTLIETYDNYKVQNVLGDMSRVERKMYKLKIPLKDVKNIKFEVKIQNEFYKISNKFEKNSSINNYKVGYYYKEKYLITKSEDKKDIKVQYRPAIIKVILKELSFLGYLFVKKRKRKEVLQRILYWITKPFMSKNIWLFADREFMGRDSAEVLFKYTNEQANEDKRKTYFAISKDSEDYNRIKQYGKVVDYHSIKYKLLFLNAKYLISSHADGYVNNEFGNSRKFYIDLYKFEYIYLTHGVLLHDSSSWLNRINKNIELNVVTSPMEYKSILDGNYYFSPEQLIKTGLPRHDNLFNENVKEENKILIMASWRSKLAGKLIRGTQKREYNAEFANSEYCEFYNKLFKDERLLKVLKEYGYKIKFCIHPSFRAQLEDFKGNKFVEIAIDVDSQYETLSSKVLITDYSSSACDFAYLRKPVIYANFDYDHIYDIHYYQKGYFDYDINGFGPNCKDYNSVITELIQTIKNGCKMEEKYKERCDEFFYYKDDNNAKRVFEEIVKHEKTT